VPSSPSARLSSAAAERNRQPILDVLQRILPPTGRALEIASGTGQHAAWFARHLPGWTWQPTDEDPRMLASIAAWCFGPEPAEAQDGDTPPSINVAPPRLLDVRQTPWPVEGRFEAVFCANMLHIAPWACCAALMQGAARHLTSGGLVVTYGPYVVAGEPLAAGNAAFDADLRARDPAWGLRAVHDVQAEALRFGLTLRERVPMPANNQMLIFEERT
jgi:SAM-dependent methyltransferase